MREIHAAQRLLQVHSDIRGPLFYEALEMQRNGKEVLKLNTGNPASFGFTMPESILSTLQKNIQQALGYCDFRGIPEAREAVAAYHKAKGIENISADDVFIGNGISEVVGFALQALLNSEDEVLLPTPCYSLWSNCVRLSGARPRFYLCDEKSDWNPDLADIRKKITEKTRAIVIINPNNPTGALYSDEILTGIAEIAREHGLLLFSDEIYDRLVMDGETHTSIAALAPDLPIVTMNGLSKSHRLCGFRTGWMLLSGPRALTEDYRQGIIKLTSMRLCANALSQLVIPTALGDGETPAAMVAKGGRIFEQRKATVSALQSIPGISFVKNKAAFYLFPKLDTSRFRITSDKRFASDLLHATNILIVPGSGFEWEAPDHFRIVMLPRPEILKDAMERIGRFLAGYKQN